MEDRARLNHAALRNLVREVLAEDIGSGDATTLAVVPEGLDISASIRARESCRVAGLSVVQALFEELDSHVALEISVADGEDCAAGGTVARLSGPARSILTGERTALNFLQRLSGVATLTRAMVAAMGSSHTKLLDTRKTTPGLRLLEKYAVTCGGGHNHRFGLYDRIMIKDNHRALANLDGPGGIKRAVAACRQAYPDLQVEVEADTLDQVQEALEAHADFILLDNMDDEDIRQAIATRDGTYSQALLEISGGVTLERLPELAQLGADFISVGAITHSAPAVDLGLDIDEERPYPG